MNNHDEAVEADLPQLFAKQRLKQWVLVDDQDRIMFQCWADDIDGMDERLTKRVAYLSTYTAGDELDRLVKGLRGELNACQCTAYNSDECACPDAAWPDEFTSDAAQAITTLKAQVAELEARLNSFLNPPPRPSDDEIATMQIARGNKYIKELTARAEAAEASAEKMREALEWLSDEARYDKTVTSYARAVLSPDTTTPDAAERERSDPSSRNTVTQSSPLDPRDTDTPGEPGA